MNKCMRVGSERDPKKEGALKNKLLTTTQDENNGPECSKRSPPLTGISGKEELKKLPKAHAHTHPFLHTLRKRVATH